MLGKPSRWRLPLAAVVVVVLAGCGADGAPRIEVGAAQANEPVAGSAQVVLDVFNRGDGADTITGAETDAAVGVEMHQTTVEDGRHTMGAVESVEVAPGETVRFRPGQTHLMLIAPDERLAVGGTFDLTLHLARTGDVTVPVEVVDLLDLAEGTFDEPQDTDR